MKHHCLITGTGRAGTSFLVQLLTELKCDTGFAPGVKLPYKIARAGLEKRFNEDNLPYIIKDPQFIRDFKGVLSDKHIVIDHIFIPFRDMKAVVASREFVNKKSKYSYWWRRALGISAPGATPYNMDATFLHQKLTAEMHDFLLALSKTYIPVTLMHYPTHTRDAGYCYAKLKPLLPHVELEEFTDVHNRLVVPEYRHSFTEDDV